MTTKKTPIKKAKAKTRKPGVKTVFNRLMKGLKDCLKDCKTLEDMTDDMPVSFQVAVVKVNIEEAIEELKG